MQDGRNMGELRVNKWGTSEGDALLFLMKQ